MVLGVVPGEAVGVAVTFKVWMGTGGADTGVREGVEVGGVVVYTTLVGVVARGVNTGVCVAITGRVGRTTLCLIWGGGAGLGGVARTA